MPVPNNTHDKYTLPEDYKIYWQDPIQTYYEGNYPGSPEPHLPEDRAYVGTGFGQKLDDFSEGMIDQANRISLAGLGAAALGGLSTIPAGGVGAIPGLTLSVMSQIAAAPFRVYQGVRSLINGQAKKGLIRLGEAAIDVSASGLPDKVINVAKQYYKLKGVPKAARKDAEAIFNNQDNVVFHGINYNNKNTKDNVIYASDNLRVAQSYASGLYNDNLTGIAFNPNVVKLSSPPQNILDKSLEEMFLDYPQKIHKTHSISLDPEFRNTRFGDVMYGWTATPYQLNNKGELRFILDENPEAQLLIAKPKSNASNPLGVIGYIDDNIGPMKLSRVLNYADIETNINGTRGIEEFARSNPSIYNNIYGYKLPSIFDVGPYYPEDGPILASTTYVFYPRSHQYLYYFDPEKGLNINDIYNWSFKNKFADQMEAYKSATSAPVTPKSVTDITSGLSVAKPLYDSSSK